MRKCIYCGSLPYVRDLGGLFYAQCNCGNFNPYEFCGVHPKNAIGAWNEANSLTAKANMERHINKIQHNSNYIYLVDGIRYESISQVANAVGCSKSAIQSKFGEFVNSFVFRGRLILRVRKAKGGAK